MENVKASYIAVLPLLYGGYTLHDPRPKYLSQSLVKDQMCVSIASVKGRRSGANDLSAPHIHNSEGGSHGEVWKEGS